MRQKTQEQFDLIIIGAGPAGFEAALEAAKLGLSTALVEKDALGGTCLNRGCIPTKTFIHSAEIYAKIQDSAALGIAAEKAALDLAALQTEKRAIIANLQKGIAQRLKALRVVTYQGSAQVTEVGALKSVSISGASAAKISAPNLLIATGSEPALPPIPGRDLAGVMTSDELLDYQGEVLPSLIIIGGGVIGVEFAGFWQAFGTQVTLIEALPSLIANMDKELSQSLRLSLKNKGVAIHTAAAVRSLVATPAGLCCNYMEKDVESSVTAQAVLIAAGRRAATQGLFAPGCEPEKQRGYLKVGEDFQTSIDGVYAVGDVNGKIQLAHAATAQGLTVVRSLAARAALPLNTHLIPACIYSSPEIASVGLTLEEAKAQGLKAQSHKALSSANGKSLLTRAERGFIKVVFASDTGKILGAQLFCERATDLVSEFAVAINAGLSLEEMAQVVRPHPTFSEMITAAVTL